MSNLRWVNEDQLPEDVRAAMRDVLVEALREAARKEDPSDGSMIGLSPKKTLGGGMWDGGWSLQSSFLQDERMNPAPFVVVHAYSDSNLTRGSVEADVVRTADDRRFLGQRRLALMIQRRNELDQAIDALKLELEVKP